LALTLSALLVVPFALLVLWLLWRDGRPVFYLSERMKGVDRPFLLWKLRTMAVVATQSGVSGGDKAARITATGRLLRKTRMDEIPQLWNVIRGDMSFVGPRPPLRQYVERFPEIYGPVLQCRPGITGLATLVFHRHEEWLLAACKTPEETDAVYARRCVPRKARLDMIYQHHRSICLDIQLMWRTFARAVGIGR
jgi:lipopolysaccharide/colanic/teichoic acid biosynthesis glycosyltransferase